MFAGPATGPTAAAPSFRSLVSADIPTIDASKVTTGVFSTARLGSGTADSTTYLRGDNTWATISGAGGGYSTIQAAGTPAAERQTMNFSGDFQVVDDAANARTQINVKPSGAVGAVGAVGQATVFVHNAGANQSLSISNANIKISFSTRKTDPSSWYNTSLQRFQPTEAGYYQINVSLGTAAFTGWVTLVVRKNGTETYCRARDNGSASETNFQGSDVVYMNGSTDYLEIYGYAAANVATDNRTFVTYFSAIGHT